MSGTESRSGTRTGTCTDICTGGDRVVPISFNYSTSLIFITLRVAPQKGKIPEVSVPGDGRGRVVAMWQCARRAFAVRTLHWGVTQRDTARLCLRQFHYHLVVEALKSQTLHVSS